ncbi:MAG: hypothetical protein VYA84_20975 [Planctomycetota bacterium]|nr:hypothetical protein [Planctomycetota bacterium]
MMCKPTAARQFIGKSNAAIIDRWQRMPLANDEIDDGRLIQIKALGEFRISIVFGHSFTRHVEGIATCNDFKLFQDIKEMCDEKDCNSLRI